MISSIVKFRQLDSWGFFSTLAFIALLSLSSCDKKEDPDPAAKSLDIVGRYILKKATLNEDVPTLKKGADITATLEAELLGKVVCGEDIPRIIELRKDKSIYVRCRGASDGQEGGTWRLQDSSTLVLTLNEKLVVGLPADHVFPFVVVDLKVGGGKITGNTLRPVPGSTDSFMSVSLEFHPFKEEEDTETSDDSGLNSIPDLYTLAKATLNEDVPPLKKGADITATLEAELLGKVVCGEDIPRIIELRKDKSIYVRCRGASDDQEGGTWRLQDSSTLVLTLNEKLVVGLPADHVFPFVVVDLKVGGGKITGNTLRPVPGSTDSFMSVSLEFHLFKEEEDTETPDDSGLNSIPGLYTLAKATLNEDVPPLKKGADITATLEAELLGKVVCGEDIPRIIELRKDKSIYVRCRGASDGQEGGTWRLQDSSTLVLTLNEKLVVGLPADHVFPFVIVDLKVEGGKITGNTLRPVPGSTDSFMSVSLEFRLFVPET